MNHPTSSFTKKLNKYLTAIEKSSNVDELVGLQKIPALFEDSSCELWRFRDNHKNFFIKLENKTHQSMPSPFWKMMQSLFGVSLSQALNNTMSVSQLLAHQNQLSVPQVIQGVAVGSHQGVVMSEVAGDSFNGRNLNKANIQLFAGYLSALHGKCFIGFGDLQKLQDLTPLRATDNAVLSAKAINNWQKKLWEFFESSSAFNSSVMKINSVEALTVSRFVPIMMDLRWDQFAMQQGVLSGVFDLDAYVAAPIELDFVILEYLLDKQQLGEFVNAYQNESQLSIPKIAHVRQAYRHLYFIINALGETDYKKWMAHPSFFA